MAARKRVNLTVAGVLAIPPEADSRPVGPLVNDSLPYGQKERYHDGHPLQGGAIFCSDDMNTRAGKDNPPWINGLQTVSSWDLARGKNPLFRGSDADEEN